MDLGWISNDIIIKYKKTNTDKELDRIFVNSIPLSKVIEDYLVITKPDSEGVVKTYKFGYEVDNPSYEYFKNFEEKGDRFKELVKSNKI